MSGNIEQDGAKEAMNYLKTASHDLFCWFASNQVKTNSDKCHLIASCDNEMSARVNNYNIANSKSEKLLSTKIDHKLNFSTHIDEICKILCKS